MRSRPSVQLFLKPGVVRAGADVTVEAILESRSDTPSSGIVVTLRGLEHVLVPSGNSARHEVHQHIGRRAAFPARTLTKGQHRVATQFHIPEHAPPSYRGPRVSMEYEVEVHVAIPWWPDRRARYVIPVVAEPSVAPPPMPRVFATNPTGPRGKDVYLECSLDDVRMEPGGVVTGAVSFSNTKSARVSHVELAFVATEVVRLSQDGDEHRSEGNSWVAKILDRAPGEAESIPFRLRVPKETPPTFSGALSRLEWRLAVIGHVTLGRDVKLEIPIEVRTRSEDSHLARRVAAAPPVGRERRARVWAAAAQSLGLESNAEQEEMRTSFGAANVILRLEHREGIGMQAVADLSWAALASEIEVRERRWTDAFSGKEVSLGEGPFGKRFHVSAVDEALPEIVLEENVRKLLLECAEVQIDDEGASICAPTSVQSAEALAFDLVSLLAAARALGEAVARAPTKTTAPYR
ncbi:MAG: sporulation protein [Polyangiales bacterium]